MAAWFRKNLSLLAILVVAIACTWNLFNEKLWVKHGVMVWDVACYYGYLPKAFNHKADSLTYEEKVFEGMYHSSKYVIAPNGAKVLKTSMGMAFMYLPFYGCGYINHYINNASPGSGMEIEYRRAMQFYGTFITLLGLLLLRSLLRRYFHEGVVAGAIMLLFFGTNLFYYTLYEGCMTHATNFMLVLLYITMLRKWLVKPALGNSIVMGLLLGLMSLIRPTNMAVVLFFVLLDITSIDGFKNRVLFLFKKWHLFIIMAVCIFVVWIPQFLYWKNVTGDYYFYSYLDERFFFDKPKILYGLLGWRKGWLIYTPLAVFMMLGFFFLSRYAKEMLLMSIAYFVLFVYIIFSWWSWWYGGSYSCRPMVDIYGILALPLAAFLQFVFIEKGKAVKTFIASILFLLVSLNLFQTYQYQAGYIHSSNMSYAAYRYVFFKAEFVPDSLLSPSPAKEALRGEYVP